MDGDEVGPANEDSLLSSDEDARAVYTLLKQYMLGLLDEPDLEAAEIMAMGLVIRLHESGFDIGYRRGAMPDYGETIPS